MAVQSLRLSAFLIRALPVTLIALVLLHLTSPSLRPVPLPPFAASPSSSSLSTASAAAAHPFSGAPASDPPAFPFCSAEGDPLLSKYGADTLRRGRYWESSGERVRSVLRRAGSEGRGLTVGVLGGSVSQGYKLSQPEGYTGSLNYNPNTYSQRFLRWLNVTLPHPENKLVNAAIGATDSRYFGLCAEAHLPEDVDIVLVEFDVNDLSNDLETSQFFETLLRTLLTLPSQPGVIILGTFSPLWARFVGYAGNDRLHLPVAAYYDVPYLSAKRMLWDTYLAYPTEFSLALGNVEDGVHPDLLMHELLSDLLHSYMSQLLCTLSPSPPSAPSPSPIPPFASLLSTTSRPSSPIHLLPPPQSGVPTVLMFRPLALAIDNTSDTRIKVPEMLRPWCASAYSEKRPLEIVTNEGFELREFDNNKRAWIATKQGALLAARIHVPEGGELGQARVALSYFHDEHLSGTYSCHVDDSTETEDVFIDGGLTISVIHTFKFMVTPGPHVLTCELTEAPLHRGSEPPLGELADGSPYWHSGIVAVMIY